MLSIWVFRGLAFVAGVLANGKVFNFGVIGGGGGGGAGGPFIFGADVVAETFGVFSIAGGGGGGGAGGATGGMFLEGSGSKKIQYLENCIKILEKV